MWHDPEMEVIRWTDIICPDEDDEKGFSRLLTEDCPWIAPEIEIIE